jgi:hypothetical protein
MIMSEDADPPRLAGRWALISACAAALAVTLVAGAAGSASVRLAPGSASVRLAPGATPFRFCRAARAAGTST